MSYVAITYNFGSSKRFKVQIFRNGRIVGGDTFYTKPKAKEWIEMNAGKLPIKDFTKAEEPVKTTFS